MAETLAPLDTRARRGIAILSGVAAWLPVAALALIVAAELVFFTARSADLLSYPYPLDYGEGPLLAQTSLLRGGLSIWHLYADPGAQPYAVTNYPPVYHLLTTLVALPLGNVLLSGRLVSLAAALMTVVALWLLTGYRSTRIKNKEQRTENKTAASITVLNSQFSVVRLLIVLAFLGLPIVREWATLMRVDMLGLSLGLWGLVLVQRGRLGWAALLLALSLFVKPSLLAAPAAALLWLLFHNRRRALLLAALLATIGGLAYGLLQIASGGWFTIHILAANANQWQLKLAHGFWHDQLLILWPLLVPAALLALAVILAGRHHAIRSAALLPLYYALFGAMGAFGIGKVGAYANYFLELYAGLIWIAASNFRFPILDFGFSSRSIQNPKSKIQNASVALLVIGALLRYYPLWSETYLKPYGMIEQSSPARVAFGQYGVWRDLARERVVLAALAGINAALAGEVRAAGVPIFTDVPGVAAQAGQLARLQVFEHRQLFDAGLWDQRPLLRDLANGRVPLVILDYLGNWLTPEMITLITHRYAQDGSRGTYDIYRPVDPGPPAAADLRFPGGPQLVGYHLALSAGRPLYQAGATVLLTLDWRVASDREPTAAQYEVVAQLADEQGNLLLETSRPLLYGALEPRDWGGDVMQHVQPIVLPPELPARTYRLAITLRAAGHELAAPRAITPITVQPDGGRLLGEQGYFVPQTLLEAWRAAGGYDGPGDPLMPATPFQGYTLQCFARACLRLDGAGIRRLPLGELIQLGDAGLKAAPPDAGAEERFAETAQSLRGAFLDYWRANGGMVAFGPPISGELLRGDRIVQYTRYARLERPIDAGTVRLGRLGDEFLRLPGGGPYRWP